MPTLWRTLASRTILKDRWIDLRADQCVTPAGVEISPYYVLGYPDWVHIVALTPDRHIVLVQQYRHAIGVEMLELPGGCIDPADATPEQAARRELAEETGFTAARWTAISALYPNPATHANRLHIFLAQDAVARHEPRLDQGEEGLSIHIRPLDDIVAGLASGLLGQAMQVVGLLLALRAIDR